MKHQFFIAVALTTLALGLRAAESPAVAALKQGDFNTALQRFQEEIKKRPDDANLKKGYQLLRTTMRRQELFDREEDPELLRNLGKPLRNYYYRFGLYKQAAAVDRRLHQVAPSDKTAVAYAVTLLNLGDNAGAVRIFDTLQLDKLPAGAQLCAALGYARSGNAQKADAIRAKFPVDQLPAGMLPLAARVAAVRGDVKGAASAARRLLENTPAKQHGMLKTQLFGAGDFAPVAAAEEFRQALATASKLGDQCAGCPNRGTAKCDHANDPDHKCEHANDPNHKCEHERKP
ncbi:MAG: hypothetical protein IJJ28_02605 [Lentisphaeria bacterium]|nr:hypothetical protein [Lentisphaeria bacterium]